MDLKKFDQFLELLDAEQRVIIQAHDFPDHDAIASAFAMAYILTQKGFRPFLSYQGFIDRVSLHNLIGWLDIPIVNSHQLDLKPSDKIIVVDGCIGEENITDLPGLEVAVIDHHEVKVPSYVWYSDVRPNYGSTATIMVDYFNYYNIKIPKKIATALLVGLTFNTDSFTKSISEMDIKALFQLQRRADMVTVNGICRNQIEYKELHYFDSMLATMKRDKNSAFAIAPEGCPENMLGVLGDFLLTVDEIDVVVLSARSYQRTFVSLRSECQENDVAEVVRQALNDRGIGYGGGRAHKAGGVINQRFRMADELAYLYELIRPRLTLG